MPRIVLTVNPVTQEDIERGILSVLKQNLKGVSVPGLCREHGLSQVLFLSWRAQSVGFRGRLVAWTDERTVFRKHRRTDTLFNAHLIAKLMPSILKMENTSGKAVSDLSAVARSDRAAGGGV
jgi:hypothetical protein